MKGIGIKLFVKYMTELSFFGFSKFLTYSASNRQFHLFSPSIRSVYMFICQLKSINDSKRVLHRVFWLWKSKLWSFRTKSVQKCSWELEKTSGKQQQQQTLWSCPKIKFIRNHKEWKGHLMDLNFCDLKV